MKRKESDMDRIGMSPIEWASAVVVNALLAVSLCGLAYTIFTPAASQVIGL